MNFIDYCLYTKNFNALNAVSEYNKLFSGHSDRVRKMINNMQDTYIHMTPVDRVDSILDNGFRLSQLNGKDKIPSISTYKDDHRDNAVDNDLQSYRKIFENNGAGRMTAMNYEYGRPYDEWQRVGGVSPISPTRAQAQVGAVDNLYHKGRDYPVNIVMNTTARYRKGSDKGESILSVENANKALDTAKLRIPFGAISPKNAEKYVPLMRDHASRLDMDDTYTRRMYNLYKKKVEEGFDPVTMKQRPQKPKYVPFQYISNWIKR